MKSVLRAHGNKEVIVVDDGSKNNCRQVLGEFTKQYDNLRCHYFSANQGKRDALHFAVTKLIGNSRFVVTIDSDTVLDRYALVNVVRQLKDLNVGAATGDVQLLNEKQNILTRMIGSYYWIGLNIYKKAQSSVGMVVCCSGCLAAYRRDVLDKIINRFVHQEFLGERCTHSEDRHLTNLVLEKGYRVVYAEDAISYTETPATIKGFLKQQQRWKRGYTRESLYTLTYAWRVKPLLFIQILFWDLTVPYFTLGFMVALAITIVLNPVFFLTTILPAWLVFILVRNAPLIMQSRRKVGGLFLYLLFYEIFLYWQSIYALFTVRNKSWITR